MKIIWRGCECEVIFLLITLILSSAPTPTATQVQRRSFCVNKTQVEQVLKRFQTGGSREEKLKQILACLPPREYTACDGGTDEFLLKEILLRLQMRERGEECTSVGKYSKPFYKTQLQLRSRPDREYQGLQDELLDTVLTFCNPFKHLYCSPQKKCECRPGTALKPEINPEVCTLIVGGYCFDPGADLRFGRSPRNVLYDPFNSGLNDGGMEVPPLQCSDGLCNSDLNYFHPAICANDVIVEFDKKLVEHFKDLPRLSFGDSCNIEQHNDILKSPETEWADYRIRVKKLEEIMGAKTQFCDLRRLLVCGNNSGKCECIKPAFYDPNTKMCTYKHPHEACAHRRIIEAFAANMTVNASRELDEGYKVTRDRECKGGCITVYNEGAFSPIFCRICQYPGNVGRNCDKTLTSYLSGDPQIAVPTDEPDWEKQIDLVTELSDKGLELEGISRLEKGSSCDVEADQEGARAIRRIKNIDVQGTERVVTKENYRETIRFMDEVIRNYSAKGLCKYPERESNTSVVYRLRPTLVCGPNATNSKCYEPSHGEFLEILRKRLIPFETVPNGQPCPLDVKQLYGRAIFLFGNGSQDFYEYLIVRLETLFVNKTQFCNTTAGLKCNFSSKLIFVTDIGKCGFSEEMMRNMTKETKTSEDSRAKANVSHFIHLSFLVTLFTLCYSWTII